MDCVKRPLFTGPRPASVARSPRLWLLLRSNSYIHVVVAMTGRDNTTVIAEFPQRGDAPTVPVFVTAWHTMARPIQMDPSNPHTLDLIALTK